MADKMKWVEYGAQGAERVRGRLPEAVVSSQVFRGEHTVVVKRESIVDVLTFLRDDPDLCYNLLSDLSGVDYLGYPGHDAPRFAVVYNLYSIPRRDRLRVKVCVNAQDPHVPTVIGVYGTANWHERETWDMFGIIFDGHPDLRKILTPDDLVGHPLRKDFDIREEEVAFSHSVERLREAGDYLRPE
jgi:NADH-quinone oxidoreductase subunit C